MRHFIDPYKIYNNELIDLYGSLQFYWQVNITTYLYKKSMKMKSISCERLWTKKDDMHLMTLINVYGPQRWNFLSRLMSREFPMTPKTAKQCRERWHNKLDPQSINEPWTTLEEAKLLLLYIKHKNDWASISDNMPNRHNNMAKNHFYSMFRKIKNRINSKDFDYKSQLELIETHYIISLIEKCNGSKHTINTKRKRGEDFLLTLVKDIHQDMVEEYKADLNLKYPLEMPVETLLENIIKSSKDFEKQSENTHDMISIEKRRGIVVLPAPNFSKRPQVLTLEEKLSFAESIRQVILYCKNSITSVKPIKKNNNLSFLDIPELNQVRDDFGISPKKEFKKDIESAKRTIRIPYITQ